MFWNRVPLTLLEAGERARREHSLWLTLALSSQRRFPRIPTRLESEGGFTRLLERPSGRTHTERWWRLALRRIPEFFLD